MTGENGEGQEEEGEDGATRTNSQTHYPMVESELKALAKDCSEPTVYLYAHLVRNGFWPSESIKTFMATITDAEWVDSYLKDPPTLRDLCMRVARSHLYNCGNIICGVEKLKVPPRVRDIVVMYNPLN